MCQGTDLGKLGMGSTHRDKANLLGETPGLLSDNWEGQREPPGALGRLQVWMEAGCTGVMAVRSGLQRKEQKPASTSQPLSLSLSRLLFLHLQNGNSDRSCLAAEF